MSLKILISGEIGGFNNPEPKQKKSDVHLVNNSTDLQTVLSDNPDERDVLIDINSVGGSVFEGFAMYDMLRMSGRRIRTNVIGGCHSIATVILLAAPAAWRTANQNCRALIHKARTDPGGYSTDEELTKQAEATKREEDRIVQIYVERTKLTQHQARAIVNSEEVHTAQDLLRMGFISTINQYTTNSRINKNPKKMNTRKDRAGLLQRVGAFIAQAVEILSPANYDYNDEEGKLLFSTASETDDLAVGTEVSFPDDATGGTFNLPDGRVVTITDYVVTEITEDAGDDPDVENLRAENETLRNQLAKAVEIINELKEQIGSSYTPPGRTTRTPTTASKTTKKADTAQLTKDQMKTSVKEKYAAGFGIRGIHAPRKS